MSIGSVVCARMIFISLRSSCVVRNAIVGSAEEPTVSIGTVAIASNTGVKSALEPTMMGIYLLISLARRRYTDTHSVHGVL